MATLLSYLDTDVDWLHP